jgi:hypothetical protein
VGDYCSDVTALLSHISGVLSNLKPERECANRMPSLGKILIILGILFFVAGVLLTLLGRTNLSLGRLPGDILYRGKNTTFYFPVATSILVSVLLTVLLYIIGKFHK